MERARKLFYLNDFIKRIKRIQLFFVISFIYFFNRKKNDYITMVPGEKTKCKITND